MATCKKRFLHWKLEYEQPVLLVVKINFAFLEMTTQKAADAFRAQGDGVTVDTHTTYIINKYHWNITLMSGRFLPLFTFTRIMAENGISQLLHPPH